jgi:hypothetical protein
MVLMKNLMRYFENKINIARIKNCKSNTISMISLLSLQEGAFNSDGNG